ncbi:MAG TPA: PP2C family protein-serine/threonine phosphatase [Ignavibacteria bacterium]|nr:PP2C family protein-serine/threonine phosphatase [Ignavibacteria bacterium]HQY51549.1 PP2C family protein-serine/threonine phosphatase [Ignavibacteria bacterium]HRB00969.1 PP2C family protein-serine/threonine phosphatase [Ignavibacteria bacterium]
MEQKKLFRTIENIIKEAPKTENDEQLLTYVLEQIIKNEEIKIIGGRLWKLNSEKNSYFLFEQMGDVDIIEKNYELSIDQYPMFKNVGNYRSVIAKETDDYLIDKGIYHYSATGVGERYKFKDNAGEIYFLYEYLIALNATTFIEDDLLNTLNIISMTLSSIIRSKDIESTAKENIQELNKAREIQKSILPEHEMKFGNFDMFGLSIPDKIVGGDFFDYIESEDKERVGIAIGDAASKGISAAAQALYVSGALRMGVEFQIKLTTMVKKINNLVYETFPYERFVTLFYCELINDKKGLCQYVNAGQNPPLFYNSQSGETEMLSATGPVLGPAPYQKYYSDSINFQLNDILVLYTDGIVEATNENFEFYGEDKLKEVILKYKDLNTREICGKIMQDVNTFSSKGIYSDDKTIVAIKRIK